MRRYFGHAIAAGAPLARAMRRALFAKADEDTARSAAGRAALESVVFAAPSVLPQRGVAWRAESDERLVARFDSRPSDPRSRCASTRRKPSGR